MIFNNTFHVRHLRDGNVVREFDVPNTVTIEGMNSVLDTYFQMQARRSRWFIGLVDADSFEQYLITDTMAAHPGWVEVVDYVSPTRPRYIPTAAAEGVVTGEGFSDLVITRSKAIKGVFVTDGSLKGNTDGLLFALAVFPEISDVIAGDLYSVTYTVKLGDPETYIDTGYVTPNYLA